jgi:hypothetical protein
VTFDSVSTGGITELTISGAGEPLPSGFKLGSPPTYYEISTTAEFEGPVEVCIDYNGQFSNEKNLKLLHQEVDTTTNDTVWVDQTVSLDTVNNIICAEVTSFSQFVVANLFTPVELIEFLVDQVLDLNLQQGIENSLDAKLDAAEKALEDLNQNNDIAAINTLEAFISAVEAQRGNQIPAADADALIASAQEIIDVIETNSGPQSGVGGSTYEKTYSLYQNYPNPFHHSTTIRYQIPMRNEGFLMRNHVSLKIYDLSGRLVRTLVNEDQKTGVYTVNWDRKDARGRELSNGVYFYRLAVQNIALTKKMVLLK